LKWIFANAPDKTPGFRACLMLTAHVPLFSCLQGYQSAAARIRSRKGLFRNFFVKPIKCKIQHETTFALKPEFPNFGAKT
jgi:hypothetical protein